MGIKYAQPYFYRATLLLTTIMAVGCSSDQELNHAYATAAKQGNIATLETLLQQGVDATDRQHGATALMWAGHEGRIEAVRFLLSRGASQASMPDSPPGALLSGTRPSRDRTLPPKS